MNKKLWEVWSYTTSPPKMVAVVQGKKEAVDKAKQLSPSALEWRRWYKIWPAR